MQYNFRGTYDAAQNYAVQDVVSYAENGITKYYFCLNSNYNTSPQSPSISGDTNYWGIINTLSNFPNSVDSFIYRVNISGNDKLEIARINELALKTSPTTSEQDELNNLIAKHRNKLFQAEDLNAIQDSLSNLQLFFKDKIESYINSSITSITTTRDNALSDLDTKKASLDLYLDSTTAGDLRVDLGVMGDLTTTNKHSLVEAVNEIKSTTQSFKLTNNNGTLQYLANGTNLNTITETGYYFVEGNAVNSPVTNWLYITVKKYTSTRIYQKITTDTSFSWERTLIDSTWGQWRPTLTNESIVSLPNQSQVSATRSLTIGMSNSGVDYKVFFDIEKRDIQSEFASSIFTPKQSGYYLMSVYAAFNAIPSGNTYVKVYKGGTAFTEIGGATNQQIISLARAIYLNAEQLYDFYIVQNSGASQTITSFNLDLVKLT